MTPRDEIQRWSFVFHRNRSPAKPLDYSYILDNASIRISINFITKSFRYKAERELPNRRHCYNIEGDRVSKLSYLNIYQSGNDPFWTPGMEKRSVSCELRADADGFSTREPTGKSCPIPDQQNTDWRRPWQRN
jgi:hypothetical protein